MAEHVRQVADGHGAAELLSAPLPVLEVADDRLARDEELVHQHLPRPDRQSSLLDQPPDALRRLGPHLEVVVQRRELAVQGEAVALVGLHRVEERIDEPDQLQAEPLEREVPLPVPVGVGNQMNRRGYLTEPASNPCTKYRCKAKKTISGTIISRNAPALSRCHSPP